MDVAVECYSYEAAEYLAGLNPDGVNIKKLENLTDSKAIIRRIYKALENRLVTKRKIIPFFKIFGTMAFLIFGTQTFTAFIPYSESYLLCFGILALIYLMMFLITKCSNVKYSASLSFPQLLKAPDYPTL